MSLIFDVIICGEFVGKTQMSQKFYIGMLVVDMLQKKATLSFARRCLFYLQQNLLKAFNQKINFFIIDIQRWRNANGMTMTVINDQP